MPEDTNARHKLTKQQRIAFGDQAAKLLESGVFDQAINAVMAKYISDLIEIVPGSAEGIATHASFKALSDLKNQLTAIKNDGTMAREEMKKLSDSAAT